MGLGVGIEDKLGIAPISGTHLDLLARILDRDDGFDEIADGYGHARQQAPKARGNFFEIGHHRKLTFIEPLI